MTFIRPCRPLSQFLSQIGWHNLTLILPSMTFLTASISNWLFWRLYDQANLCHCFYIRLPVMTFKRLSRPLPLLMSQIGCHGVYPTKQTHDKFCHSDWLSWRLYDQADLCHCFYISLAVTTFIRSSRSNHCFYFWFAAMTFVWPNRHLAQFYFREAVMTFIPQRQTSFTAFFSTLVPSCYAFLDKSYSYGSFIFSILFQLSVLIWCMFW